MIMNFIKFLFSNSIILISSTIFEARNAGPKTHSTGKGAHEERRPR